MGGKNSNNMYVSGEYIRRNPTLDVEDTQWKLTKTFPFIDKWLHEIPSTRVKVLDVGGGAGLFLKGISEYLTAKNIRVEQYALDLSREMLEIQKRNNPDIKEIFEGSIEKTSFDDKEVDLVLMIDVIEHVPDAGAALKELRRISKYAIFKVPLENNLYYNVLNLIKGGRLRRDIFQNVGHLNYYTFRKLSRQLAEYSGDVLKYAFINDFEYVLSEEYHRKLNAVEKVVFASGNFMFAISPCLSSCMFPVSIIYLVKCR